MSAFSPDRREQPIPLPEVEEQRNEVRRVSVRIRVPADFCHVEEDGSATPMHLTLFSEDDDRVLADCMLYDINDGGIGFASPDILAVGDRGRLVAHLPGSSEAIHSGRIRVLHGHEARGLSADEIPERFRGQTLMVYGTRLEPDEVRGFMRATLESLAHWAAQHPD